MNLRTIFFFLAATIAAAAQTEDEWNAPLQKALETANVLHVRSESFIIHLPPLNALHSDPKIRGVIKKEFFIENADLVRDVIRHIQIINPKGEGYSHCLCYRNPHFDFYENDKFLLSLSLHHGTKFRWKEGKWKGDAYLSSESSEFLVKWLTDLGIDELKKEIEARKKKPE